jgi:hypothetical protein
MGGIGKSTLAAQIATRVDRLQSGRVVTVVNGEVPASAPWPAETDFVILDNFDDNLSLRTAEIAAPAATARRMLAFVRAQRSPYLATRADLTPGPDGYVLTIEFGAPAPLGMLR